MRDSSATRSVRLLKPWTLALAAGAVGGLLLLTYHGEEVFLPDGQAPDAVSANYAELLLAAHPEDAQLRQELIQLLVDLGEYERARQHLLDWSRPDPLLASYYRLEIDALSARQGDDQDALRSAREQLLAFDRSALSVELLERLARHALVLEVPGLAADIHMTLAERQPAARAEHLEQAARWYLASNRPAEAGAVYYALMLASDQPQQRLHFLQQAYAGLLAAGQGERASGLLADELERLGQQEFDPAWLDSAVQVAMGSRRFDLAERIVRRWRAAQPSNPAALQAEFNLYMAFGDIRGAWTIGQALVAERPDDVALLRQMAQLGEWNGYNADALSYWIRYLELQPDPQMQEHAWRLALQLFDFDRGIPLLTGLTLHRRLSDQELDALIYSHESRGTPDQAEHWLRGYLSHYPQHRLAWMRLIQNLENTQQFQAETEAWAGLARHFPLSVSERVDWAEVHWKLFDPRRAWELLDVDASGIREADYWRVRAALAWELEDDAQLRFAYEQMLANEITLDFTEESQLISLYRQASPRKALDMLVASWARTGDSRRLLEAMQLADEQADWTLLARLLDDAGKNPATAGLAGVLAAQAALAIEEGRPLDAERIYRLGMARFPSDGLFRERLLWLLIDQGRLAELPPLLQQWRSLARRDSRLWLPFAAASQMLGRHEEALAWYRRYLQGTPQDWLVHAAYADALEGAGRFEQALRLRHRLVAQFRATPGDDQPQRYATWLRMLASSHSQRVASRAALTWKDGSPAMLQVWFDRLLDQLDATDQEAQKDAWIAWAQGKGLKIERYDRIQQALRQWNRATLERLLADRELDAAQRVEALRRLGEEGRAMGEALSQLGEAQPLAVRQQLWRQALEMHERSPQGIRLGWQQRDFGGLELAQPQLTVARHLSDDWYASLDLSSGRYDARLLDSSVLGREDNALLQLRRELADGSLQLTLDSSVRSDQNRHGLGVSRRWRLDSNNEFEAGIDWHRESSETGMMRALGRQDSLWLNARHSLSARDQLSWSVARRRYQTRYGDSLGDGFAYSLQYNHVLQFEGPTWMLRSGIDYQDNALGSRLLADLSEIAGGPLRVEEPSALDLLQDAYGQVYVGSSWRRGFPGALNRTRAQYTWLVDVMAGWQWTDSTFNYGVSTGIGMEVLGDDELAFSVGYQSAPRGGEGEAGGTLGVSYSLRFGR